MPYPRFNLLTRNPERDLCWKCGLAQGEEDMAGCTMDVLADHDFVDPASRPYSDWSFDELTSRYGRARLKARSALLEAEHLAVCPEGGPDAGITSIYRQKAMKRFRLADLLWAEIKARIGDELRSMDVTERNADKA